MVHFANMACLYTPISSDVVLQMRMYKRAEIVHQHVIVGVHKPHSKSYFSDVNIAHACDTLCGFVYSSA